jgi:hypothetical protein
LVAPITEGLYCPPPVKLTQIATVTSEFVEGMAQLLGVVANAPPELSSRFIAFPKPVGPVPHEVVEVRFKVLPAVEFTVLTLLLPVPSSKL